MNKYLAFVCATLTCAYGFWSCDDDSTPTPPVKTPTVTVTPGEATPTTLTFTITPSEGVDKAAFNFAVKGEWETVPTAEELLETGTPIEDMRAPVVIENLDPETTYVIAVAVAAGEFASEVVTKEMTTATGTEIQVVDAYGAYYAADLTKGPNGHFSLALSSIPGFSGDKPTGDGYQFLISFHSDMAADPDNAFPADGTYEYDFLDSFEKFTIDNSYSQWAHAVAGQAQPDKTGKFNGASMTIAKSDGGYDVTVTLKTDKAGDFVVRYSGPLSYENLSSPQQYDLDMKAIAAVYVGPDPNNNPDSDQWVIQLVDNPSRTTALLMLTFYAGKSATPDNPAMPEGTFTAAASGSTAAGGFVPGYEEGQYIKGSALQIAESSGVNIYLCNGGSFTVSKSGDSYTVSCNLTTAEGKTIEASYTGPVTVQNEYEGSDEGLKLNYAYNGGYNGNNGDGSHNYYVELSDKEIVESGHSLVPKDGGPATLIALDLYSSEAPSGTPIVIPAQTYTVSPDAAPGNCCNEYSGINYWDAEGNFSTATLNSGTVTVAYTSGTYTITIDVVDSDNTPVKATYTGAVVMEDYSAPARPSAKLVYSGAARIPAERRSDAVLPLRPIMAAAPEAFAARLR